MEFLSLLWSEVITKPMTNSLLLLYVFLGSNLGVAIIAFTVVVRGLTYPLVVRQLRQTRRLQSLQPRIKEINEKYKNNPQLRGQEVMKLYKEMGVNPVGCLGPLVIQMPIFIGLFWAINGVLPFTPENLAGLSSKLYSWLPSWTPPSPSAGVSSAWTSRSNPCARGASSVISSWGSPGSACSYNRR